MRLIHLKNSTFPSLKITVDTLIDAINGFGVVIVLGNKTSSLFLGFR